VDKKFVFYAVIYSLLIIWFTYLSDAVLSIK